MNNKWKFCELAKRHINNERIWEDGLPRPENAIMLQKGKQEALDERARFQKSYKDPQVEEGHLYKGKRRHT